MLAHTDRRSKDFMRGLPFDLRFAVGDAKVHLVHGSPRKVNEYLFEDKPDRLYERLAATEDADVLVFGHTHKPWIREHGGVLFVNCGSVGKPKDGDPRAAFAVLDGERRAHRARRIRRRRRRPRGRGRRAARRVRREAGRRPAGPLNGSSRPRKGPRIRQAVRPTQQPSPRHASAPSLTATAAISRPTTGSSHQAPAIAFPARPTSSAPAR